MKNVMILTGHGEYAKGIRSNLTFIAGENEDLYAVDFLIDDTEETLTLSHLNISASKQ